MSNQHHGIAQELEERKWLDDDQSTLASVETQGSYWALLEAVPVPGGTPEPGDKIMCEDAGAKQIDPGLDTHKADPAVDKPATDTRKKKISSALIKEVLMTLPVRRGCHCQGDRSDAEAFHANAPTPKQHQVDQRSSDDVAGS